MIDTMYYQGDLKSVLEKAVKLNLPVLLIGETGVGKTSFVRDLAKTQQKELVRLNLTGQTGVDEFIGKFLANKSGTYWVDGSLTDAMKKGKWIVLDEINMALPEILAKLHSLLDDDHCITINEKDGEVVHPHEDFRIFATMNPSDEYAGTKELNRAFFSRFPVVLSIDYSPFEKEILIERTKIAPEIADNLIAIAKEVRFHKEQGKLSSIISTRDLIYCSTLIMEGVDMPFAIQTSMLNKFPRDEGEALKQLVGVITKGRIKIRTDKGDEFKSVTALVEYAESQVTELANAKKRVDEVNKEMVKNQKETEKYKRQVALYQTRYKKIKSELEEAIPVEIDD